MDKKIVRVAAAIILNENKFLATLRNHGKFKGYWEFAGGKLESGETSEEALIRELKEELSAKAEEINYFCNVVYHYEDFILDMDCFTCKLSDNEFTLNEHAQAKWIGADEIWNLKWLPADDEVLVKIEEMLRKK